MPNEKIFYYKKQVVNQSEKILVRLKTIENSEDWNDTEILYIGCFKTNPFSIFNLRYQTQKMISENDYKSMWSNAHSWLKPISESEFADEYLKSTNYLYQFFCNR